MSPHMVYTKSPTETYIGLCSPLRCSGQHKMFAQSKYQNPPYSLMENLQRCRYWNRSPDIACLPRHH